MINYEKCWHNLKEPNMIDYEKCWEELKEITLNYYSAERKLNVVTRNEFSAGKEDAFEKIWLTLKCLEEKHK